MFMNETDNSSSHFLSFAVVIASGNEGIDTDIDKERIIPIGVYALLFENFANNNCGSDAYRLMAINFLAELAQDADNACGIFVLNASATGHNSLFGRRIKIV